MKVGFYPIRGKIDIAAAPDVRFFPNDRKGCAFGIVIRNPESPRRGPMAHGIDPCARGLDADQLLDLEVLDERDRKVKENVLPLA